MTFLASSLRGLLVLELGSASGVIQRAPAVAAAIALAFAAHGLGIGGHAAVLLLEARRRFECLLGLLLSTLRGLHRCLFAACLPHRICARSRCCIPERQSFTPCWFDCTVLRFALEAAAQTVTPARFLGVMGAHRVGMVVERSSLHWRWGGRRTGGRPLVCTPQLGALVAFHANISAV